MMHVQLFRDVEDMASHRMDHLHGLSRHIIRRGSEAAMFQVSGLPDTQEQADCLNKVARVFTSHVGSFS